MQTRPLWILPHLQPETLLHRNLKRNTNQLLMMVTFFPIQWYQISQYFHNLFSYFRIDLPCLLIHTDDFIPQENTSPPLTVSGAGTLHFVGEVGARGRGRGRGAPVPAGRAAVAVGRGSVGARLGPADTRHHHVGPVRGGHLQTRQMTLPAAAGSASHLVPTASRPRVTTPVSKTGPTERLRLASNNLDGKNNGI